MKTHADAVVSHCRYPYSSPEFQMRKLADFAFMLGDYKFALSTYETARKDFAADRAYKHVAGALVKCCPSSNAKKARVFPGSIMPALVHVADPTLRK